MDFLYKPVFDLFGHHKFLLTCLIGVILLAIAEPIKMLFPVLYTFTSWEFFAVLYTLSSWKIFGILLVVAYLILLFIGLIAWSFKEKSQDHSRHATTRELVKYDIKPPSEDKELTWRGHVD